MRIVTATIPSELRAERTVLFLTGVIGLRQSIKLVIEYNGSRRQNG